MVDNVFIQCDYCKAKIRMRFQMGYFDIPFDFPCPECGVHIHGLRRITEEHSLKLNNAAVVEFDLNEPHYYADFSVELPHAKTTKFESIEKIVTKGFSPFLMSSNLYKEDDYIHLIADMQRFLSFRDFFQLKLAPLYDLFFNGRISLTPEHFLKISPRFEVKNELDAMMALHQSTILGMSAILHDNALSEFAEITKKITERKTLLKVNRFIVALGGHEYFSFASKRLISIYLRWMKDFEKYIPEIRPIRPEGSFLVWLDCREMGMDSQELYDFFLKKAKVGLSDGAAYGPDGVGFERINIGCTKATLETALQRIRKAMEERRGKNIKSL